MSNTLDRSLSSIDPNMQPASAETPNHDSKTGAPAGDNGPRMDNSIAGKVVILGNGGGSKVEQER